MKLKRLFNYCLILLATLLMITGCTTRGEKKSPVGQTEIFVSAAASLTDAMQEIGDLYQKENPKEKMIYNFGSSGALQAQIQQGAPADIFIAAAQKQMDALAEKNLLVNDSRKDLLLNKVVLIAAKDSKTAIQSFAEVTMAKRIALGEPKGVPVGQYAEQIFLKFNLLREVKAKAVYGADVRQVLTWVENGEAEVGVVYATDAAVSTKISVLCEAPIGSHQPVVYPAAVLKDSKNIAAAKRFMTFLQGKTAADVFKKYGFLMKE